MLSDRTCMRSNLSTDSKQPSYRRALHFELKDSASLQKAFKRSLVLSPSLIRTLYQEMHETLRIQLFVYFHRENETSWNRQGLSPNYRILQFTAHKVSQNIKCIHKQNLFGSGRRDQKWKIKICRNRASITVELSEFGLKLIPRQTISVI